MIANKSEEVLDALLELGYTVEITDEGQLTATNDKQVLYGRVTQEKIEWANGTPTYHILEQAYIARLRKRIRTYPRKSEAGLSAS